MWPCPRVGRDVDHDLPSPRFRRVTADTALFLARYFATADRFWLNLQTRYDLQIEKDHLGTTLEQFRPLQSA